jgi:hypothetical protein
LIPEGVFVRTVSEVEVRSLKAATDAAYQLGGGVSQFPALTRVNVSTLSKYASFNEENAEFTIPIDIAVEADRRAKDPVITAAMAAALGYRLEPEGSPVARREVNELFATEILSETMDVSKAIIEARADGRIDSLENKKILKEAREAKRSLEQLIASLEGKGAA